MSIKIEAVVLKNINFAACHQGSKIIPSITIKGEPDQEVILHVRAVPAFFSEYKEKIVFKQDENTISNVPVHLDDTFYRREVIEARDATVQIEICDANDSEKILAFEYIKVHLQPYLHWNRSEWEGSMTAFMQPNDPLVARILNRAGELANEEGGRMVGYQTWPNSSVKKQAEWIFRALQEENIHYICPPPGFEFGKAGQKIRIPGMVLQDGVKQGTCLDLAVLYASCLEAASLNSVLFLIYGHAFAGVWLEPDKVLEQYPYRKWKYIYQETRENNGKILPIECTWYTDGLGYTFENAAIAARSHLEDKDNFHCALDVCAGRCLGYVPAFTFTNQPLCDVKMEYDMVEISDNPSLSYEEQMERLRAIIGEKNQWHIIENTEDLLVYKISDVAIWKGLQGAQVIIGPDNNKKKHTIANIVAEQMHFGKSVLLVKEKSQQVLQNPVETAVNDSWKTLDIFQQKIQQFLDRLGILETYENEKKYLKQMMSLAAFLKKCPVYGETFKVHKKDSDAQTDELIVLTKELMRSTPGSYHYEDVSGVLWNKVEEGMQNAGADEFENLNAYAMTSPLGGMPAEQMRLVKERRIYDAYIEELRKHMENRPVKEKDAFTDAAAKIVQGKGKEILDMIADAIVAYTNYVEAQKRAKNTLEQLSPRVVTGSESVAKYMAYEDIYFDLVVFDVTF